MAKQRIQRLNSLLREVISDVIRRDVKNPHVPELITVTQVEITNDLHHAKVHVSVIDPNSNPKAVINELQKAAGFIGTVASKQVVMRYFPQLTFVLDESVTQHLRIEELIEDIRSEREHRDSPEDLEADEPSS